MELGAGIKSEGSCCFLLSEAGPSLLSSGSFISCSHISSHGVERTIETLNNLLICFSANVTNVLLLVYFALWPCWLLVQPEQNVE